MIKNKISFDDTLDLIYLLRKIYLNHNLILKTTLLFLLIGVSISLFSPVTYKSNIKFSLLSASDNSPTRSSISNLASIAGINLNIDNSTSIIDPKLYPIIFKDFKFRRDLLKIELEDDLTFKDHILTNYSPSFLSIFIEYTIGIPSKIISLLRSNDNLNNSRNFNIDEEFIISKDEKKLFEFLDKALLINVNDKDFTVEISSQLNNPIYATIVTKNSFKILEKKLIDLNIKSSYDVLNFNLKNFEDKKIEFISAQTKLAKFQDNNQVISSSKFNAELFILENEFELINSVYQEIAKQVELSKIQITKDTPVFTILKDSDVPTRKHSPKRAYIVIIWSILGLIFSSVYILTKNSIKKFLNEIIS